MKGTHTFLIIGLIIISLSIPTTAQNKTVAEVPFIISQTGQILVEASINEKGKTYFYIETAEKNRLRADQPQTLVKFGIDPEAGMVDVFNITLGDYTFENQTFYVRSRLHKRGDLVFPPPVIGSLGPEFFKGLLLQIDFKDNVIRIAQKSQDLSFSGDTHKIMYRSSFRDPSIHLDIETRQFGEKSVTISTRSPLGIHLYYSSLSPGQRNKYKDLLTRYRFKLNGEEEVVFGAYTIDEIFVEQKLTILNQEVWLSDSMSNSIGINFLKNFIFTIDFQNQMLYFDPINQAGKDAIK